MNGIGEREVMGVGISKSLGDWRNVGWEMGEMDDE